MWSSKNLSPSDYNQDLLKEFTCDYYLQTHDFDTTESCDSIWADQANLVTPSTVELGWGTQKLLHYTMVFQMFVFMQLFNQINARKIEDGELNVFSGFFTNFMFLFVTILTFAVQITMVQYGGKAVKTWPLNQEQNIICLCFGIVELPWGLLIKFIPVRFFQCFTISDEAADEEGEEGDNKPTSMVNALKGSSSAYKKKPTALRIN